MAKSRTKPRTQSKKKPAARPKARPAARARPATGAMKPAGAASVSCSVCMKLVPRSKALKHDATDHPLYFCGTPCLEQWRSWERRQDQDDIRRAIDDGMQDLRMRRTG